MLLDDHDGHFKDLGDEVLEDGGEVDRGSDADSVGVSAVLKHSGDSAYWEAETGLGRPGGLFGAGFSFGFSFSFDHCC